MASLKKRGSVYYAQYYLGTRQKRVSLETDSLQVAKQKLRQLESALARGEANPLPTKTTLADVLDAYVRHIRAHKTPNSAQTEIYYLREAFGPICAGLGSSLFSVGSRGGQSPGPPGILRFGTSRQGDRRRTIRKPFRHNLCPV